MIENHRHCRHNPPSKIPTKAVTHVAHGCDTCVASSFDKGENSFHPSQGFCANIRLLVHDPVHHVARWGDDTTVKKVVRWEDRNIIFHRIFLFGSEEGDDWELGCHYHFGEHVITIGVVTVFETLCSLREEEGVINNFGARSSYMSPLLGIHCSWM